MNQLSEESLNHAHRKFLLKEIEKFEPFKSLHEFGCGEGANLALLADKYPGKHFYGYDISNRLISREKREYNIEYFDFLDQVLSVDIILVDAVFIYIEPVYFKYYINKLKSLAQKGIILFEWNSLYDADFIEGHWAHNYREVLPGCKINRDVKELYPDDLGWQQWGAFITWLK